MFTKAYQAELPHRLFVYGTMKRGCRNHGRLSNALYLGDAITVDAYRLVTKRASGGYVAPVLLSGQKHRVAGELYLVSTRLLHTLDLYEGVPYAYQREVCHLEGHDMPAWVYYGVDAEEMVYSPLGILSKDGVASFVVKAAP